MRNYRRLIGLLSLLGLLGLFLTTSVAEPHAEPLRDDVPLPVMPVERCLDLDTPTLPEPIVWERPTCQSPKGCCAEGQPRACCKEQKLCDPDQREALIAQLLPILETTRSPMTFMMTLEILVALEAPPAKLLPICLRAMERADEFKPLPRGENDVGAALAEGIGSSLEAMLEQHIRVRKEARPVVVHGIPMGPMGMPVSPLVPPGMVPFCPLEGGPCVIAPGMMVQPSRLPEPVPTAQPGSLLARPLTEPVPTGPSDSVPTKPATQTPISNPVPLRIPVPLQLPVPKQHPKSTAIEPIPTVVVEAEGQESGVVTVGTLPWNPPSSSTIPVKTLPTRTEPTPPGDPMPFDPNRLVPVPSAATAPLPEVRPCTPR